MDAAAQRYTRQRPSGGRMDTWEINRPRTGLSYRAASTTTTNTGAVLNLSEAIGMGLPGTGVGVYTSVAATQNFFGFSVIRPCGLTSRDEASASCGGTDLLKIPGKRAPTHALHNITLLAVLYGGREWT